MPEWTDDAIIIGTRRHGEASLIVETMTREHGRHLGYLKGGASRRRRPLLQVGNSFQATWKARLAEQMGNFGFEIVSNRAFHVISTQTLPLTLQTACEHVRHLAERQPDAGVFQALDILIDSSVDHVSAVNLLVRFELRILEVLGFGLDLTECTVSGSTENLAYVSPKTGRAVSMEAAGEWSDRLLRLPSFVLEEVHSPSGNELADGLRLTGHFLDRRIYAPKGIPLPATRHMLVEKMGNPPSNGADG